MCKHNALIPDDASSLKTIRDSENTKEKVKTLTGEELAHIVYYPIFDALNEQRIISILEVGYKKKLSESENLMTESMQVFVDQFRSSLDQFKVRLQVFTKGLESIFKQR